MPAELHKVFFQHEKFEGKTLKNLRPTDQNKAL